MLQNQTYAFKLAYTYGFCPIKDTKYEVHRIPDEKAWVHVINIANRPQNINIAVKVDTTAMEAYDILESDA